MMRAPRDLPPVASADALMPGHVRALAAEFAAASLDAVGRGTGDRADVAGARARFTTMWNLRGMPPRLTSMELTEDHVKAMLVEFTQECQRALGRVSATPVERNRARARLAASWNAWRKRG